MRYIVFITVILMAIMLNTMNCYSEQPKVVSNETEWIGKALKTKYGNVRILPGEDFEEVLILNNKRIYNQQDNEGIDIVARYCINDEEILVLNKAHRGSSGGYELFFLILARGGEYRILDIPYGSIDDLQYNFLPHFQINERDDLIEITSRIYANVDLKITLSDAKISIGKHNIELKEKHLDEETCKSMYNCYRECTLGSTNIDNMSLASYRYIRPYLHDSRFNKIQFNKLCSKSSNSGKAISYKEFKNNVCM